MLIFLNVDLERIDVFLFLTGIISLPTWLDLDLTPLFFFCDYRWYDVPCQIDVEICVMIVALAAIF